MSPIYRQLASRVQLAYDAAFANAFMPAMQNTPSSGHLAPQDVHLWLLDTAALTAQAQTAAALEACAQALCSTDEWQRAARFTRNRLQHLATRILLRQVLALHTGIAAQQLIFSRAPQGKPGLACGGVQFNLSHSGNLALLAVSKNLPLGVDIEQPQRPRNYLALAEHFFAASEIAWLSQPQNSQPEQVLCDRFYQLWTAKEALLKALGCGIANHLNSLCFIAQDGKLQLAPDAHIDLQPLYNKHWQLHQQQLPGSAAKGGSSYLALAVASERPIQLHWHNACLSLE